MMMAVADREICEVRLCSLTFGGCDWSQKEVLDRYAETTPDGCPSMQQRADTSSA